MPGWLRVLSHINPLSYEVDALRGMLIGTHAHVLLDFGVMVFAVVLGILMAQGRRTASSWWRAAGVGRRLKCRSISLA